MAPCSADPRDKRNTRLLHKGTLLVAQFNPDGTGRWIPLELTTPIDPVVPSVLGSADARGPGIHLPRRQYPPAQTQRGGRADYRWRIADRDHPGYQRLDRAQRGRGHHELQDQRRHQTRRDRNAGGLLHQPGRGPLRRLPRGQPGRRHASRPARGLRGQSAPPPRGPPGDDRRGAGQRRLSRFPHLPGLEDHERGERHAAVRRALQDHEGPAGPTRA